jgi:DNA-binding PadR family transcriptional regulator
MGHSQLARTLSPALLLNGWVMAGWGESEHKRCARYYTLTPAGRRQLASEHQEFQQIVPAIQRVLSTA